MKKLTAISLALFAFSSGAFAQGGSINLDNSVITPNLTLYPPGILYSGTFGLDLYELNTTTLPSNINPYNGFDPFVGYNNMISDGYKLEASFINRTITPGNAGVFQLGEVVMPDVSPAGSTVALALVAWDNGGSGPLTAPDMGVITFLNPTAFPTGSPPPTPPDLTGWQALNEDLIMGTPEPSSFALTALGVAAFMLNRHKK